MAFLGPSATTTGYGLVQIGNNLSISNGVISSNSNSNSAGNGSNLLGTWTPTITAPSGSATLTINDAHYVKSGQLVTCLFDIAVLSESLNGSISMEGLPFTSITSSGYVGSLFFSAYFNLQDTVNFIGGTVLSNSSTISLWQDSGNPSMTVTAMVKNTLQSTSRLVGTIQYISSV